MNKDEELRLKIMDELRWEGTVDNPVAIGVAVKDGIVTLSGYVDNLIDSMAAEELVSSIPEVKGVVQNIKVRLPTEAGRSDEDVAKDCCAALDSCELHDRVTVVVDRGWVTLNGLVHWQMHREKAEAAIRGVRGVLGITNNIVVRPPLNASDIKQQIIRAFERMVAHHVSHLEVTVDEGKVILSGMVRAGFEKFEAERVVREMPGVTDVENRLTICPLAEALEKKDEEGGAALIDREADF